MWPHHLNNSLKALIFTLVCILVPTAEAIALPAGQSGIGTTYIPTYAYTKGQSRGIGFIPNHRIAEASGEAKVERKSGMTEIEIELDEMKTALHFGGDFATYVLWAVSPEGTGFNLGEFVLKGNRSKLNVSTHLQTFGMMVTAEPHFMVESPSPFIVLSNEPPSDYDTRFVPTAPISFIDEQDAYHYTNTRLTHAPESSGEVRTEIRQANVALQLAERARAPEHAATEFRNARRALDEMILAVRDRVVDHTGGMLARTAIRLAVHARKTVLARTREAGVIAERVRFREQIAELNDELEETKATLEQEIARASGRERSLEIAIDRARERTEEALSEILAIQKTAEGLILGIPDPLFDSNRTTLKPETREMLSRISGILQLIPGFHIHVEGHSDSVGSADYNESLSKARAMSVQDYLLSAGLPARSVSVEAIGETEPLTSNDTPEGREQNRRVRLVILNLPEQAARVAPEE